MHEHLTVHSFLNVAVDCGTLFSPDNGTISLTGTTFMNTATYSCSVGYTLINGDQVRECQPDGTWSGTQPTCQGGSVSSYHSAVIMCRLSFIWLKLTSQQYFPY